MYPMALMWLSPLFFTKTASLPHVFELLGEPPVPNPILESHESHLFSLLLTIPILALEVWMLLQTILNPSLLQSSCNEPCKPINSFHFSRPSEVARYCPSAISEYRESACLWMTMNLSCWSIFIPRWRRMCSSRWVALIPVRRTQFLLRQGWILYHYSSKVHNSETWSEED